MKRSITLDASSLTEDLWHDGNLARLYLYLLSKTDGCVSFRSISRDIGLTLQAVRTGIEKLMRNGHITQVATQKTTQVATQIRLCGIDSKCRSATQVATQKTTQAKSEAKDGFERFREYFNNAVYGTSIPQITKLTDARKNALRSIFREYEKETVETVIQKTLASDFLCREWGKVSFDWIFKKANFIKILEGNYDNGTAKSPAGDYASRKAQRDRGLSLATEIVSRSENLLGLYNGQGPDSHDS
ncbi:MAG: hypothetical protein HFJ91_00750 [Muribaculaceae bacterium]|nr:hypothetical protein [Muribaculaceae bacterium]